MDPMEKPYKFVVRLPTLLRNQIKDAAKYYRRSMNSEIVARLERSFSGIQAEVRDADLSPALQKELEILFGRTLSENEQRLIRGYRRLSAQKQQALIELLT
jgi:hypothetical protein